MAAPSPRYRVFESFWKCDRYPAKRRASRPRWRHAPKRYAIRTEASAREESKTACAAEAKRSTSEPSPIIRRISRSPGAGFPVTKLPQMKTRRSSPDVAASPIRVRKRPSSHKRLAEKPPNRDSNSCQWAECLNQKSVRVGESRSPWASAGKTLRVTNRRGILNHSQASR